MLKSLLVYMTHPHVGAWNFGPGEDSLITVSELVERLAGVWGPGANWQQAGGVHPHEEAHLMLNCEKAQRDLGWQATVGLDDALHRTISWYKAWQNDEDMLGVCIKQIEEHCQAASKALQR